MFKLQSANSNSIKNADIIIIGIPDNSKSHSKRKGIEKGPDALRFAYNETNYFKRGDKNVHICPMKGRLNDKKIFDLGNTTRKDLMKIVKELQGIKKIQIILGGDHSLTTIALNATQKAIKKKISLIYFDAHPDFVSSIGDYYGSVWYDSRNAIDFDKSMQIGIRAAEPEEIDNIKKNNVTVFTPLNILDENLLEISNKIIKKCKNKVVYISIDLDCIDPGFAPGVSVPTSAGLTPIHVIYLVKKICENLDVIGVDIVELTPDYDKQSLTANLGARLLLEIISSLQNRNNESIKNKTMLNMRK